MVNQEDGKGTHQDKVNNQFMAKEFKNHDWLIFNQPLQPLVLN